MQRTYLDLVADSPPTTEAQYFKQAADHERGAAGWSPAKRFMMEQLKGVTGADPRVKAKWQQAVAALGASDIPLDPRNRWLIAAELRLHYLSDEERARRGRIIKRAEKIARIRELKDHFTRDRGMAPGEADEAIAEIMDSTVENLKQWIKRARRKGV